MGCLQGATHILAAAQRGLDFAVAIGALRHLNRTAIGFGQLVVFQGCVTVSAGSVYGHVALVTFVGSHADLRRLVLDTKEWLPNVAHMEP